MTLSKINSKSEEAKSKNIFFLDKKNAWLLWLSQLLNILLISTELMWWMLAIIALLLCWQALHLHLYSREKEKSTMNRLLLFIFALSGCVVIAISAKALGALLSMVHLLAYAYVLKSFEIKTRKDFYQTILLGLFLLASSLIFKQTLLFTLVTFIILIVNLSVLLQQYLITKTVIKSIKTMALLLLQSIVLATVLFVIFPRLSPFWQVPIAKSAKTGLSDIVAPGDIASLALSNELAFRVSFKNKRPFYSQLYWRAMVLEHYDGKKWTRIIDKQQSQKNAPLGYLTNNVDRSPNNSVGVYQYQVTVQPSYQKWLFALPVATTTQSSITQLNDYTIQNNIDISQVMRYQAVSDIQVAKTYITPSIRSKNLQLPDNSNPKLLRYGQQLKMKFLDERKVAQAVLSDIRLQKYFYTLSPPLLNIDSNNNSLDQFYYQTKAGFCVHYASAFTFIMRAAGIPSRVVTGYLGGEYNSDSDHLSIYQYDAHAWSEIWIEGFGWQRIDPTASVDPQRVSSGLSSDLLQQQSDLNNQFFSLHQFKSFALLNSLRLKLDAMDYQWTRWILGYSSTKQLDLLTTLFGHNFGWKISLVILFSLGFTFIIFYLINKRSSKAIKQTPWLILYNQALYQLVKKELLKSKHTTVKQFANTVSQELPYVAYSFRQLSNLYMQLAYQSVPPQTQSKLLLEMKKVLKRFKAELQHKS